MMQRVRKNSEILRAEAKKEAMIKEAEGEAQAILAYKSPCRRNTFPYDADPSSAVLQLRSMEAFEKAADGKAQQNYYSF